MTEDEAKQRWCPFVRITRENDKQALPARETAPAASTPLPCPFDCDNHGGMVVMRATRAGGLQVFCNSCNARGPVKRTRTDAIAVWNRRAPPEKAT